MAFRTVRSATHYDPTPLPDEQLGALVPVRQLEVWALPLKHDMTPLPILHGVAPVPGVQFTPALLPPLQLAPMLTSRSKHVRTGFSYFMRIM
jgi:hypothetical protein